MNEDTLPAGIKGAATKKWGKLHGRLQRLTAIMLVPLSLWFIASMACMTSINYSAITIWMATPVTSILFILFVITLFFHAQLGLQIVIEDYIRSRWQKIANIILIRLIAFIAALSSVITIVRIFLYRN